MRTLDSWRSLLAPTPHTIDLPKMELMSGRDHEPPVLVGQGRILMQTPGSFKYEMEAVSNGAERMVRQLQESLRNPYDAHSQFRLAGTDDQGTKWLCGWTRPTVVDVSSSHWSLIGGVSALSRHARTVSAASSVELVFLIPAHHPVGRAMTAFVLSQTPRGQRATREYVLHVLGTQLHFSYDPAEAMLSVVGQTSELLSHPFVENWIGEPLRIMFGQLIYPRVSARNFGDGTAAVSLRPSPSYVLEMEAPSLWFSGVVGNDKKAFWDLYSRLLALVARAGEFQSYNLTKIYEELVQAARGSRWVQALTLASSVEALVTMLISPSENRPDANHEAIASLCAHIGTWKGPPDLKSRAIDSVHRAGAVSPIYFLRNLRDRHVLPAPNVKAWEAIRNSVMHGKLVPPWPTEAEEDARLRDLAELVHRLTGEILARSSVSEP